MRVGIGNRITDIHGKSWTPKSVFGLVLWNDASRADTLTIDGANKVSAWRDLSGNAKHFAQATADKQPLYVANALNGRPVIRTDGIDDVLVTPAMGFTGDQNLSIFMVYKLNSGFAISSFSTVGNEGGFYGLKMDFSSRAVEVAGSGYLLKAYIKTSGYLNPTGKLYVNGGGTNVYTNDAASYIPNYSVNSTFKIGGWASAYGPIDCAEVIIYNRAVTAEERIKIETNLRSKYALW